MRNLTKRKFYLIYTMDSILIYTFNNDIVSRSRNRN